MRYNKEKPLGDVLKLFVKEFKLEKGLQRTHIFARWNEVVGPVGAKATVYQFFRDGILYCTISSSIVRNTMFYQLDTYIKRINEVFEDDPVKKIILK
ncbi:MAG: DUF721 domain-containing protein [Bacteroidales bacterium]